MAGDTVAAALACPRWPRVIVVTDDQARALSWAGLGALVVPRRTGRRPQPGAGVTGPRTPTSAGRAGGGPRWPRDLPALRPAELGRALRRGGPGRQAFVADAAGTGTTLYTAGPGRGVPAAASAAVARARHRPRGRSSSAARACRAAPGRGHAVGPARRGRARPRAAHPGRAAAAAGTSPSDVHDRAGQRPGDPGHALDLRDDQLAEVVDVVGLGADDHVVGAGDVVRLGYAGDLGRCAWPRRRPCRLLSGRGCKREP